MGGVEGCRPSEEPSRAPRRRGGGGRWHEWRSEPLPWRPSRRDLGTRRDPSDPRPQMGRGVQYCRPPPPVIIHSPLFTSIDRSFPRPLPLCCVPLPPPTSSALPPPPRTMSGHAHLPPTLSKTYERACSCASTCVAMTRPGGRSCQRGWAPAYGRATVVTPAPAATLAEHGRRRGGARVRRRRKRGAGTKRQLLRCVVGARPQAGRKGARVYAWERVGRLTNGFLEDSGRQDGGARGSARRFDALGGAAAPPAEELAARPTAVPAALLQTLPTTLSRASRANMAATPPSSRAMLVAAPYAVCPQKKRQALPFSGLSRSSRPKIQGRQHHAARCHHEKSVADADRPVSRDKTETGENPGPARAAAARAAHLH